MYERLSYEEKCVNLSAIGSKNITMDMDIDVYTLTDESLSFFEEEKEVAVLLLEGALEFEWNGNKAEGKRRNVFDDMPFCLHIPAKTKVICTVKGKTQFLVQKAVNRAEFEPVLFKQEDFSEVRAGDGFMENTSTRLIRTIFDYKSAPYSNMVLGEVIADQGRWSSYPPHHHDQPEVYYYKFDKPQGFGCAMVDDQAYKVYDHSYITIDGGYSHPPVYSAGIQNVFLLDDKTLRGQPLDRQDI